MAQLSDLDARIIIGRNLRRYRGERSYADIARAVGTYPTAIKRIEDGESMPGAALLLRIADSLGVSLNDMMENFS